MTILNQVDSPADLRRLNKDELGRLSDEVRQQIIDVVEEKGGTFLIALGCG